MVSKQLIYILFLLISCTDKIDLKPLDKLILQKKYTEALDIIERMESLSIADSLIIKKIMHRKILAKKGQLFINMDTLFLQKDTSALKAELIRINTFINTKDSVTARWFYFDYYFHHGLFLELKSDTALWLKNVTMAITFPTSEQVKKNSLFLDIAFYYAQNNHFVTAREWLDKALRSLEIEETVAGLDRVYLEYMNGRFLIADSIMAKIDFLDEQSQWKRVQSFLNLYADSLTMENRFRLW